MKKIMLAGFLLAAGFRQANAVEPRWRHVDLPEEIRDSTALSWAFDPVLKWFYVANSQEGLFVSKDEANNFSRMDDGSYRGETLRWSKDALFAVSSASNTVLTSRDHGRTWTNWPAGNTRWGGTVIDVTPDPNNHKIVLVHSWERAPGSAADQPVAESLWWTADDGVSFRPTTLDADRPISLVRVHGMRACVVFHDGGLFCAANLGGRWDRLFLPAARETRDVFFSDTGLTAFADDAILESPKYDTFQVKVDVEQPNGLFTQPLHGKPYAFTTASGNDVDIIKADGSLQTVPSPDPMAAIAALDFENQIVVVRTRGDAWLRGVLVPENKPKIFKRPQ